MSRALPIRAVGKQPVVLPAWDGSKTALVGSKSGLVVRKASDLAPYISETGSGRALAGTTKSFPTVLVPTKSAHRSIRSHSFRICAYTVVEITRLSTNRMLRPELELELRSSYCGGRFAWSDRPRL